MKNQSKNKLIKKSTLKKYKQSLRQSKWLKQILSRKTPENPVMQLLQLWFVHKRSFIGKYNIYDMVLNYKALYKMFRMSNI